MYINREEKCFINEIFSNVQVDSSCTGCCCCNFSLVSLLPDLWDPSWLLRNPFTTVPASPSLELFPEAFLHDGPKLYL